MQNELIWKVQLCAWVEESTQELWSDDVLALKALKYNQFVTKTFT